MKKVVCRMLSYALKKCRKRMPPPDKNDIKRASKDVAWEYAAMLGAALEMAKGSWEGSCSPMNHFAQEAFLTHVRNLAEFFREGVREFKKAQGPPPRAQDNIYAVDFCHSVGWRTEPFGPQKKLIRAINKTLSHPTYSRHRASQGHVHFEGYEHVHGTVKLMRQTWADFIKAVKPEFLQPQCPEDIDYWLGKHTENWRVKFSDFESVFETRVNELVCLTANNPQAKWVLDTTLD